MNNLFRCPFCSARCATGPELTEAMHFCDPTNCDGTSPAVIHAEPVCDRYNDLPTDQFMELVTKVLS